ncbi:hypothetical protein BO83DRAFT_387580 [Aspergillus eucalypticola CBS 122712]|uniref:Uncharacterized protein n=1 Tax=Aspergillus eucalypticola (strain CBS 122712 / IBT 29274) TaxID=1448314 RepID=A0A317VRN7_ASPEC|nr:uncharacterized protein BO83DRAFT_387580 [Aspergillus eucalypticola CBS 122712]PWY75558.1 hypothetical protein BO83DRAFT_387580 [Aspergillus eucalypticola CBS 122712]
MTQLSPPLREASDGTSDFTRKEEIRPNREPRGPAIWLEEKGIHCYHVICGYYILSGDVAHQSKNWLINYKNPLKEQAIVSGIITVGAGATTEKPVNFYFVEQKRWSNFKISHTTIDFFFKAKCPILVNVLMVPNLLKTKVTFVASKVYHDFRQTIVRGGLSGGTGGNLLFIARRRTSY